MLGLEELESLVNDSELRDLFMRVSSRKVTADLKMLQANAELAARLSDRSRRDDSGPLKQIVREHLEYYNVLVEISLNFYQRVIDMLAEEARDSAGEPTIHGNRLTVRAAAGGVVRTPFVVRSDRATPVVVVCHASPFVSEDGSQLIPSNASFAPNSAEIGAGGEQRFELILSVGSGFTAGRAYLATVSPEGLDEAQIVVRLEVDDNAKAAAPPPAARAGGLAAAAAATEGPPAEEKKTAKPKPPAAAKPAAAGASN